MDYLSQITMLKLRLPSEELLNKSRQELIGYELAKASPGAGWGYFPGMEHHEALFYPETIHLGETLQEMITSIKISGPDYYYFLSSNPSLRLLHPLVACISIQIQA